MVNHDNEQPLGWIRYYTPKDDWHYLSVDERDRYLTDFKHLVDATCQKGARKIGTYKCRGQSPWMRFELWEFPSITLLIEFSNELESIGHYQYFEEDHSVGRLYDPDYSPNHWTV